MHNLDYWFKKYCEYNIMFEESEYIKDEMCASVHTDVNTDVNADVNTNGDWCKFTLSYDDIRTNLRLLCDIKENEKIMLSDKFMTIDQRYIQSLRRYITADSRTKTIDFIDFVANSAIHFCSTIIGNGDKTEISGDDLDKLLQFQALMNGTLSGLNRLAITYGSDKLSRAKIETIQSNIRTFDELHLKRCICKI